MFPGTSSSWCSKRSGTSPCSRPPSHLASSRYPSPCRCSGSTEGESGTSGYYGPSSVSRPQLPLLSSLELLVLIVVLQGFTCFYTLFAFITFLTFCQPISGVWDRTVKPKCYKKELYRDFGLFNAGRSSLFTTCRSRANG